MNGCRTAALGCLGWVVGVGCASPLAVALAIGLPWVAPPEAQPPLVPASLARAPVAPPPVVYDGVVLPVESVEVSVPFDARISEWLVEMGDPVTRGQLLGRVDADALADRIDGERAAAAASRSAVQQAELAHAEAVENRAQLELARSAIPAADLVAAEFTVQRSRSAAQEAHARHAQQRAALAELETALQGGEILAPIDGVVAARLVSTGASVSPGQPLLHIAGGELGVRFAIEPQALGRLEVGDLVQVEIPVNGVVLPGQVLRVAPWVDAASGVVLAEASVAIAAEDAPRVVAGMTARVSEQEDDGV